ncbi:hypothetical protein MKZ38_006753 [Zalerion maritima]|uniref:Uncharacterized protein n=1 Tax=Zalerion maritima TaxID=339359 RepID=A0AAD5RJN3_9PEZI|nr:hypothetical protein MKZ38_006753 [Zalerion maritima]
MTTTTSNEEVISSHNTTTTEFCEEEPTEYPEDSYIDTTACGDEDITGLPKKSFWPNATETLTSGSMTSSTEGAPVITYISTVMYTMTSCWLEDMEEPAHTHEYSSPESIYSPDYGTNIDEDNENEGSWS